MKSFLKQEMNPMPSSLDNKKKHVRFGLLTIDEYPTVLGHSVIPRSGPPITIGQKPFRRTVMGLDRFENAVRSDRRRKFELLLDENVRISILLAEGYSIQEVTDATSEATKVRIHRVQSAKDHEQSTITTAATLKHNNSIAKALSSTGKAIKSAISHARLDGAVRHQQVARTA